MKATRPSDLELQILSVLWRRGPSTVRQVLHAMPDGKKRAYTTILSTMQVMEKKKLVTHTAEGLAHVYRPAVSKRRIVKPLLRNLITTVFGGSASAALQHLLTDADVSDEELAEIRALIDDHQRRRESLRSKGAKP